MDFQIRNRGGQLKYLLYPSLEPLTFSYIAFSGVTIGLYKTLILIVILQNKMFLPFSCRRREEEKYRIYKVMKLLQGHAIPVHLQCCPVNIDDDRVINRSMGDDRPD